MYCCFLYLNLHDELPHQRRILRTARSSAYFSYLHTFDIITYHAFDITVHLNSLLHRAMRLKLPQYPH